MRDIEHWKTRSGVVKVNLALGELPDFTANPGTSLQEHHTGSVEMAPSMEYIERAFIDAREGRPAARPFSDGVIPTAFDKTLAPEGHHIMSLFTQWVPSTWSEEPHREELEKYADRVIDAYNEVAPNFKAAILHRDVVGPYEMEHDYGLIGGNIFHGELSLEQLFHLRPAPGFADYRTPVRGLYYASSADPRRRRRLRHPRHAGGQGRDLRPPQAAPWLIGSCQPERKRPASDPLAVMLEARSVALVGASPRAGSLGARMIEEVAKSSARPRTYLVNPAVRRDRRRARATRALLIFLSRSTWRCSPFPTPRSRSKCGRRRLAAPVRR